MLFYQRISGDQVIKNETANLELSSLVNKKLLDIIDHDNKLYETEERKRLLSKSNLFKRNKSNNQFSWSDGQSSNSKFDKDNDDDNNQNDSSFSKDSGPRIIF